MRLTKLGHACVRIEHEGAVVVIDPGGFTDVSAVDGATSVLITHQHPDHYSADNLRASDAEIFTISAVAEQIGKDAPDIAERVTVVGPGQDFDPGMQARAVGQRHAVIHPEIPRIDNSGYLVSAGGQKIFHPGDALTSPGEDVDLLLLPVSAPWLKVSECIDFARDVGAPRSLAIHDMVYSEAGLGIVGGQLSGFLEERGQEYVRLQPGEDL